MLCHDDCYHYIGSEEETGRSGAAGGHAEGQEEAGDLAAELKALEPEAGALVRRLALVDEFGLWKDCARERCRRAGKCRGEDAECYDEQRDALKQRVLECVIWLLCTADVRSDEFYDYLHDITDDFNDDDQEP